MRLLIYDTVNSYHSRIIMETQTDKKTTLLIHDEVDQVTVSDSYRMLLLLLLTSV